MKPKDLKCKYFDGFKTSNLYKLGSFEFSDETKKYLLDCYRKPDEEKRKKINELIKSAELVADHAKQVFDIKNNKTTEIAKSLKKLEGAVNNLDRALSHISDNRAASQYIFFHLMAWYEDNEIKKKAYLKTRDSVAICNGSPGFIYTWVEEELGVNDKIVSVISGLRSACDDHNFKPKKGRQRKIERFFVSSLVQEHIRIFGEKPGITNSDSGSFQLFASKAGEAIGLTVGYVLVNEVIKLNNHQRRNNLFRSEK